MIDYDIYEEDEVIRPRHREKKPRTKKADHKHSYIKVKRVSAIWGETIVTECSMCGKIYKTEI